MIKAESACRDERKRMQRGCRKVYTGKTPLTGVVVVSFYVIQIMGGSVFSLEIVTETRVVWLSEKQQIWDMNTKMHKITAAAAVVYLPQSCVSVCCFTQSKAWSRERSQMSSSSSSQLYKFMPNWKLKLFAAYLHTSPAQSAMWTSMIVSGSQTCSSVAVSNSNQTADGPLATFLGCHVEHTLHLQKQLFSAIIKHFERFFLFHF